MQIPNLFPHKKSMLVEGAVVLLLIGGIIYFYLQFSQKEAVTIPANVDGQLLGQNFVVLVRAINEDRISFTQKSFMQSPLVERLQDFSEEILPTESRGRAEPFSPYASTGSIR